MSNAETLNATSPTNMSDPNNNPIVLENTGTTQEQSISPINQQSLGVKSPSTKPPETAYTTISKFKLPLNASTTWNTARKLITGLQYIFFYITC